MLSRFTLSPFLGTPAAPVSLAFAALTLTGCPTNQSAVCQSIGDCSQGGSSDWVQNCQNEASLLQSEAQTDGCGTQYDDYYSCAASSFTCQGTTASFPGCDAKLAALDTCINAAESRTACAALTTAEATCGGVAKDGGAAGDDAAATGTGADEGGATEDGSSEGDAGADASVSADAGGDAAAPPSPSGRSDAGPVSDAGSSLPIACTAARDCEARCYLDVVADVCAPQVDELDEFYTCASACPP